MNSTLSRIERRLIAAMEKMEIIDAHEHLPPEHMRVSSQVDVFTLFSHYTHVDLRSAGMIEEAYQRLFDREVPLSERWRSFREWLPYIRHGSYARPAFIAAREFYGCDDINDDTYELLSERMQAANTPGIYRRVLRDKCHIARSLPIENTVNGKDYENPDLFSYLKPLGQLTRGLSAEGIRRRAEQSGMTVRNLDDYLDLIQTTLPAWAKEGAVGLKTIAHPIALAERSDVEHLFSEVLEGKRETSREALTPAVDPLRDFLIEAILPLAAELGLVVAVHTGMWHDFRVLDPKHFLPVFMQHLDTQFDLFHMGMPWVRDTAIIAKNCPNVTLNLCWTHIISPVQTRSGLDEYIDLVPLNKIIGFGADYHRPVEKVYGHLVMARENIAAILGGRVEQGLIDIDEAIRIAKMWLYDNPVRIYNLDVTAPSC